MINATAYLNINVANSLPAARSQVPQFLLRVVSSVQDLRVSFRLTFPGVSSVN